MANISRTRSRSVSTVPLTRTTGLSLTCRGSAVVAVAGARGVAGAWEATWAVALSALTSRMLTESLYFIIPRSLLQKKRGEKFSPPGYRRFLLELRRNVVGVVSFVRLAKVALTAELSRRGR